MDTKQSDKDPTTKENEELPKLAFKRLKFALQQVVDTAIPLHVDLLNTQSDRIEELKTDHRPLELRSEQLKASNSVKLLRQDLCELENLNRQVREEDQEQFQKTVEKSLKDAVEALSTFMSIHSDVLGPFLDIDNDALPLADQFPQVVCDINGRSPDELQQETDISGAGTDALQLVQLKESKTTADAWSYLKRELLEIHGLIRQFSTLVFGQQESVDSIQGNILQARENVREGTQHLRKASFLKGASFPIAGALLGGAVLGPIGGLVGLKLFGIAGCILGGGTLGYTAGKKIKKRQQNALEGIEMKALTYPSKACSASTPDLSSVGRDEARDQKLI